MEPTDPERVRAIYSRYVTDWDAAWERQATSPDYRLWSLLPQRGMAVAYPGLKGGAEYRWTDEAELLEQSEDPQDHQQAPQRGGRLRQALNAQLGQAAP